MKLFKTGALAIALLLAATGLQAQRIKLEDGDLSALKGETSFNLEFTYQNMKVGKFDDEKEYIAKKTEEYNKKEAGRGDNWAKNWVNDRSSRFEPKFIELFEKGGDFTNSKSAKYTLIINTDFTEPGYNIGISSKPASANYTVKLVETANKSKVIATFSIDKALGRTFGGYDFDTGLRIAEAYADAGKAFGKFLKGKI